MNLNSYQIDIIKKLCLDANVDHYKIIPIIRTYFSCVYRAYHREIINQAKDEIAKLTGSDLISVSQVISERERDIQFSKMNREYENRD